MPPPSVQGIPCEIASVRVRQAIARVFRAMQRYPPDWNRFRRRVHRVGWLPDHAAKRVLGEWSVDQDELAQLNAETQRLEQRVQAEPEQTQRLLLAERLWRRQGNERFIAGGQIRLARRVASRPLDVLVALMAHECGNAVTRARDFNARECYSDDEWASELSADMYHASKLTMRFPPMFKYPRATHPGELVVREAQ
jgi:hypothetical protein